ncbi:PTS transporter subunit EIIC [Vibrio parahaemolyticus]|uniref:PTS transporter subunit EIIC n=1 Tax=Vibrio parahaemolyticus TaxID=670 RepID=UPI0024BD192E|nr:PTS transporter subunit EIIC [Vibrio parahaemolyticus]WHT02201.1 PTS transporter subunit EIIC [Vibrio parahaemolyticus]
MNKVFLICAGGLSTSLLVKKIRESAEQQNYPIEIEACGEGKFDEMIEKNHLCLVAPQLAFKTAKFAERLPDGKKIQKIDRNVYGLMDGDAVLDQIRDALSSEATELSESPEAIIEDEFADEEEKSGFAQKVSQAMNNKYMNAIRDGFISSMAIMIIGSLSLILVIPPFAEGTGNPVGRAWYWMVENYGTALELPYSATMGIMSIWVAFLVGASMSSEINVDKMIGSTVSVFVFLLMAVGGNSATVDMNSQWFGAQGIFTAMISGLFVPNILAWCKNKKMSFGLPSSVPDNIRETFDSLIPFVIILFIVYPAIIALESALGQPVPALVATLISPLISATDTYLGMIVIVLLVHVLWFFGVHGAAVVLGAIAPFTMANTMANMDALIAGEALPYIVEESFYLFFVLLGGSGATAGLVILMLKSKSKQMRTVGKLGGITSVFNINEPIIFGAPIVANTKLIIPFILTPIVTSSIAWVAIKLGVIRAGAALLPLTVPAPIGAAWAAGWSITAFFLICALTVVSYFIYLPFFKSYEKDLVAQESATAK